MEPGRHDATALIVLLLRRSAASCGAGAQAIPARIVSTSPSITETLFALGLGDRVVGVSTYCRYPPAVAALPKVGTFLKPDAETIARLKPDLVFVHEGPNTVAAQLARLGLKTARRRSRVVVERVCHHPADQRAAGVPDEASGCSHDVNAGLDRVKASVAGRAPRKILIVVGRRTGTLTDIIAVGPGSYLNDIAAIAGGSNVLASATLEYPRISMETVISSAPDVIVDVGEMGESPADSDRRRRITEGLWQSQTLVKAVRDGWRSRRERRSLRRSRSAYRLGGEGHGALAPRSRGPMTPVLRVRERRLACRNGARARARLVRRRPWRVRGSDGTQWRGQEHAAGYCRGAANADRGCGASGGTSARRMDGDREGAAARRISRRVCERTCRCARRHSF